MPLNKLQSKLLDMWKILKEIIDENNIRYFAIGGTAIGALRNKGFIPWDDDIDIAVFYEDTEKLMKAIDKDGRLSTSSKYNKKQPYFFTKAYNPNTTITEDGNKSHLFIDIFYAIEKRDFSSKNWKKYRRIERLLYTKAHKFDFKEKSISLGFKIAQILLLPIPFKLLKNKVKKLIINQPITDKNYRNIYHDKIDESYNTKTLSEMKFQNSKIFVPKSFPEDARHIFGDIYVKPNKDDRYNHNIKVN